MATPAYFTKYPDVAQAYLANNYGLTPEEFAAVHYAKFGQLEKRISPGEIEIAQVKAGQAAAPTNVIPYFRANPDVANAYLSNNYGLTPEQFAAAHFAKYGQTEKRLAPTTSPFANATQGFAQNNQPVLTGLLGAPQSFSQNFQNYQSIPIGAQYNPGVVGGTGSPYSQIMNQMRPANVAYNPYIGVASNTPMGGYDPALYDQIAGNNAARLAAEQVAALLANQIDASSAGGGDGGSSGGNGGGTGAGAGTGNAMAKGGYVHGGLMFGPNPPGPDDGAVNLDMGEYVVKKSSVDKYGKGLLDMINEGKVPAKKMKSLLG
jgi:hypothetical protein